LGREFDAIVAAATEAGVPSSELPCVATRVDLFAHLTVDAEAFGR
jgi:hypothetical protein